MTGTTGKNVGAAGGYLPAYLERVRAAATVPVCAGFGIRTREQVEHCAARSTASSSDRRWWRCWSAASRRANSWRACRPPRR